MTRPNDDDIRDEVRAHLEMATRDRIDRGEEPSAAAAAARRDFGNVARVQELTREVWAWTSVERLAQDLRYAVRLLFRARAFSFVAILSLALGIGVNTAIFQVINAVRLRTLPVARASELVEITPVTMEGARGNFASWRESVTNPIWEQVRGHQQAFAGVLAVGANTYDLSRGGEAHRARTLLVSGSFFDVLGVSAAQGRVLTVNDDRRGCALRAVLSHSFWQRQFGADPSAVGRTLTLDGHAAEIIGVAAEGFFGLEVGRTFDVAVPICAEATLSATSRLDSGTDWWLVMMGRLKPGLTVEQASTHLASISPGIFRDTLSPRYPQVSVPKYLAMSLHGVPAPTGISYVRELYASSLWLLLGLAALLLLIAAANLANLMLARASAREREIAIRLGLGASRGRVVRQLVTESFFLATLGGIAGVWLARMFGEALVAFVDGDEHALVLSLSLDWRVAAFAVGLTALSCLVFGLAPAVTVTRLGGGALSSLTGRGVAGPRRGVRMRRVLTVAQVAISVVLLFGALLFTRTLRNLRDVPLGFDPSGVTMVAVDLQRVPLAREQRLHYKTALLDRLRAIPGVDGAATTVVVPVSGDAWGNNITFDQAAGRRSVNALFTRVSRGFLATMRTPLVEGRDFDEARDIPSSPRVAIVNRTLALQFPGGSAVGRRFTVEPTPSQPATEFEVIGVSADAKYLSIREQPTPVVYFPASQDPRPSAWALVAVRSRMTPAALTGAMTAAVRDLDPNIGLSFDLLDTQIRRTLMRERLMATLSGFFGSLAGVLAVIGLYGVIAYSVTRRTNEIGVRMALGASTADVVAMVLRDASVLVGAGVAIGLVLSAISAQFASTLLFQLRPRDPVSLAGAALLLGGVALIASYLPARTAARIEPTVALRVE